MELNNNIKQIGSIGEGTRIYIEDYVMTFIKYMEEKYVCDELVFALLGNLNKQDEDEALFISGIVRGRMPEKRGSIKVFSKDSWEEISRVKEKYFKDLEIVGWAYVQPGYGDFLNENHIAYHIATFEKPYQVLYITDPLDRSKAFYRKEKNGLELKPVNGYFIYYDRNEAMHEYLLEVKKEGAGEEETKENLTENVDNLINLKLRGADKTKEKNRLKLPFDLKISDEDAKNAVGLMGSLSFALLFVTLIIGGGLLKSNSRIAVLEEQLSSLGRNYTALKEEMDTNTREVFAAMEESAAVSEPVTEAATEIITEAPKTAEQPKEEKTYREYRVKKGDTLLYLSRYFYGDENGVSDIMTANNMSEGDFLIEGKTIKIPEK